MSRLSRPGGFDALTARRLAALRKLLLPPEVWRNLSTAGEVVVVPDRELHRVPFESLVLEPGTDAARTRFWIDDGPPIRYAASATFLATLSARGERPRAGEDVLSVSNPNFGQSVPSGQSASRSVLNWKLAELPGTADETSAIQRAFRDDTGRPRVRVLQGGDATERNLRRAVPGRRYVHVATHGLVDAQGGEMFAALALTAPATIEDTADDGFLQLFEVYELELTCDLLVLSACESNFGPLIAGEGVFALSRGFFAAGANRVVASQWPVADDSTALLIGRFFESIAQREGTTDETSFAELLRDARRIVRREPRYAEPYYWAPFVFMGLR